MISPISDYAVLNNGVKMPWLGLGVYKLRDGEETVRVVKKAIEIGYRSIDTAALYGNEQGVGQAIKESDIAREELFVTTKVWNDRQGYETTLKAFEESRKKLDLDYLDLYLIHWPVAGKYKETWKALEKLYKEGYIRAIGVSNFQINHLQDLLEDSEMVPMVNQVEYHPYLTQKELHRFCKKHQIQLEAWSPLVRGKILNHPYVTELSRKYHKTPAQIILRWDLQHEVVTIPKTSQVNRLKENADIFDFELHSEDMQQLDQLDQNLRVGPDPDNFNF